jgi:hypothetical protein
MKEAQVLFFEELANKLRGFSAKVDYPLSNRVQLNLSKEEVDTLAWLTEKYLKEETKNG